MSIFDQSRRDANDARLLRIDDHAYGDDADMERILHRLTMAAADTGMRHKMNVEDEYYGAIEKRDTEIMMRNQKIAEQGALIKEQVDTIKEQVDTIKEQGDTIKEQDNLLRSTIKLLLDAGMTPDLIAVKLGVTLEKVHNLI